MKTSTTLIIVLITTTVSSSCSAMQLPPPQITNPSLHGIAGMGDVKDGGIYNNIKGFLSPEDSKNTHATSKPFNTVNSSVERNLIIDINEDSISRIKKSQGNLLALTIRSNSEMGLQRPTQTQISTIVLNCPLLKELSVDYCENAAAGITQALIQNPAALQHLKKITLSFANPTDNEIRTIIQHCPGLEELNLSNCNEAAAGIEQALTQNSNTLQQLKTLNLTNARPTANQITTIAQHCHALEELNLSQCQRAATGITQALIQNPVALQHLKKITLSFANPRDNEIRTIIQHCPGLEELNLNQCRNATTGIAQALTQNPNALQQLKTLNLTDARPTANQITTIAQHCPTLKELNLSQCRNAATGIAQVLTQNPNALQQLKTLNLGKSRPTAEQITTIALRCPALEELNLNQCRNATTGIAQALTQNLNALQQLTRLNLYLTNPTTEQITTIAQHCHALKELDISNCDQAPAGITAALSLNEDDNRVNPTALQKLTILDLNKSNPTTEQITAIAQRCPALKELDISDCDQAPAGIAQALALDENGNRINLHVLRELKIIITGDISEEDFTMLQNRLPGVEINN